MSDIKFFCKVCQTVLTDNYNNKPCCFDRHLNSKFLDFRPLAGKVGTGDIWSEDYYNRNSKDYDDLIDLTFTSLNCDEASERDKMYAIIKFENIRSMLEVGCGTGRDTTKFIECLNDNATLHASDLSEGMLEIAETKFSEHIQSKKLNLYLCNAHSLPYEDSQFDCVFHFGGLNTFDDIEKAIGEMVRVCKVGGQIVLGDESIAPWLRNTEFYRILSNSNPHFKYEVPLDKLPKCITDLSLNFIMNSSFYVISCYKTAEEVEGNYHFEIPGFRGGSLWKRLHGNIEGIDPILRDELYKFAQKNSLSRVNLTEKIIKDFLEREKHA